jgi:SagB-type dehydrogenase family enzyme
MIVSAQELTSIKLNAPELEKGKPLMQVLKNRRTDRAFSDKKLSIQELSNLLWAANGINRDNGKRTAPSAMNSQDIEIYVVLQEGVYFYDATKNELTPIAAGDFRKQTGNQPFVATAPVNLVLVSDVKKIRGNDENAKMKWANVDVGYVSQNIYLYCASEGLATVVRGMFDSNLLSPILKLRPEEKILLVQTVGYAPTKSENDFE